MKDNRPLEQTLDYYYTDDVCVVETEEEMNELLIKKTISNEN